MGLWFLYDSLLSKVVMQQSPVAKLATETLYHFCTAIALLISTYEWPCFGSKAKNPNFPVAFGAVSRHWRQVAWTTPSWWPPLCLRSSKQTDGTFEFSITVLSLYLKNSMGRPIHVAIAFPYDTEDRDELSELIHPSVDPLLRARMPMIQTPVLINLLASWPHHLSNLSNLRKLEIHSSCPIPSSFVPLVRLTTCRSLRHLSLYGIESMSTGRIIYKIPLPITTLELSGMPIDTCIKLALQSPNITNFAYVILPEPMAS